MLYMYCGDFPSLLAEVSHDEAKMRERRETISFLSFLPHCERPLLAGNDFPRYWFYILLPTYFG